MKSETPPAAGKTESPKRACAICGRPRDAKYDPFCSKRCADVDLYRWLKGTYVIPGAERPSVERDSDEED
jgi:endogenous inhibitor of DNA gyrase (YacG/DUF329 family)